MTSVRPNGPVVTLDYLAAGKTDGYTGIFFFAFAREEDIPYFAIRIFDQSFTRTSCL